MPLVIQMLRTVVIERFNQTLKERMWRYFTHTRCKRYVDVLQNIVDAYNRSYHSSIKMPPYNVTLNNTSIVRANLEKRYASKHIRIPKYNVGDLVRISSSKAAFAKAYEGGWSKELFLIIRVSTYTQPPTYFLRDLQGEDIDGIFYEEELTRVRCDLAKTNLIVDKIIQTKGRGRMKRLLVSWFGFPEEKFNTWIRAADLKKQ